jgi:PilZ domain-containing protein
MTAPTATRRYPRVKSPKGLIVRWQTTAQRAASFIETLGMGGLFVCTKEPPAAGTMVECVIDIPGNPVRARAVVRNVKPGEGMGLGIVSMTPEDRARLSNYLKQLPS